MIRFACAFALLCALAACSEPNTPALRDTPAPVAAPAPAPPLATGARPLAAKPACPRVHVYPALAPRPRVVFPTPPPMPVFTAPEVIPTRRLSPSERDLLLEVMRAETAL